MRVLILGGTSYVGPRLARHLSARAEVTIASRRAPPPQLSVEWIRADRNSQADMDALGRRAAWDIVYDQLCYDADGARIAAHAFGGRVGRYVLASSQAVYPAGFGLVEEDFDPIHWQSSGPVDVRLSYGAGKRQAEAAIARALGLPSVAARLPPVMATDDPRQRLEAPLRQALSRGHVTVECASARVSLTHADECAAFLAWLADAPVAGPVNLASRGALSLREVAVAMSDALGQPLDICERPSCHQEPYAVHTAWEYDPELHPLSVSADWVQSGELAERFGFRASAISAWFPELLKDAASRLASRAGAA